MTARAQNETPVVSVSPDVRGVVDLPTECSPGTRSLLPLRLLSFSGYRCGMTAEALVTWDVLRSAASNQLPAHGTSALQHTFIARRSSSISLGRAALMSGAAGKPTYLATPDRIETSRLYAVCCLI